ncbi:MAG TPA: inositol monophosphatase family protein [Rubricoccaceae bacterium]|jgi:myo-inositol-1(or 4)-monophosphatase
MSRPDSPYLAERRTAEAAALAAAAFIREHAGRLTERDVRSKTVHDLVTFVDEGAQRIVLEHLTAAFPDDAIVAEEGAHASDVPRAGRVWIVDPLDGTTNFTRGVPPYAVSVGLHVDAVGTVGVVLDVSSGELFAATRGEGLTVDGVPAHVSTTDTLDAALLATGFPFRDYGYVDGYLATFERAIRATRGVRRHGAAAVDLAWTAAGRFDGYLEAGIAPWDVAAGIVLVEAAGGRVTGLWDGADPVRSGGIVASNGLLHDAIVRLGDPLGEAYRRSSGG